MGKRKLTSKPSVAVRRAGVSEQVFNKRRVTPALMAADDRKLSWVRTGRIFSYVSFVRNEKILSMSL